MQNAVSRPLAVYSVMKALNLATAVLAGTLVGGIMAAAVGANPLTVGGFFCFLGFCGECGKAVADLQWFVVDIQCTEQLMVLLGDFIILFDNFIVLFKHFVGILYYKGKSPAYEGRYTDKHKLQYKCPEVKVVAAKQGREKNNTKHAHPQSADYNQ